MDGASGSLPGVTRAAAPPAPTAGAAPPLAAFPVFVKLATGKIYYLRTDLTGELFEFVPAYASLGHAKIGTVYGNNRKPWTPRTFTNVAALPNKDLGHQFLLQTRSR